MVSWSTIVATMVECLPCAAAGNGVGDSAVDAWVAIACAVIEHRNRLPFRSVEASTEISQLHGTTRFVDLGFNACDVSPSSWPNSRWSKKMNLTEPSFD